MNLVANFRSKFTLLNIKTTNIRKIRTENYIAVVYASELIAVYSNWFSGTVLRGKFCAEVFIESHMPVFCEWTLPKLYEDVLLFYRKIEFNDEAHV